MGTTMLPKTNFMLGEARFFLRQMQSAIESGPPYVDQRIRYYLSAFLSAGENVIYTLGFEANPEFSQWFPSWREKLTGEERIFLNRFNPPRSVRRRGETGFRGAAVHKGGAPVKESTEFVPVHFGQFEIQFFGPPGSPPPKVGVRRYELDGVGDVQSACRRHLGLLERLVSDFTAVHCESDGSDEQG